MTRRLLYHEMHGYKNRWIKPLDQKFVEKVLDAKMKEEDQPCPVDSARHEAMRALGNKEVIEWARKRKLSAKNTQSSTP